MDLVALIETVKVAIAPAKINYRVLITQVDPRSLGDALDAQQSLMNGGVPVFNGFVRGYKAHERAPIEGIPITEAKGRNAKEAASDYQKVADELLREWGSR
jgi:chromosome partitioning protein